MNFEVVDRRKEKQAAEEAAPMVLDSREAIEEAANKVLAFTGGVQGVPKKDPAGALSWQDVGYTLVYLNVNNNQVLAIRAVGLRSDEKMFTADWAMPPVLAEEISPQLEARKRLETFKCCSCRSGAPCDFHTKKCPGRVGPGDWIVEDVERIGKVQSTPLPKSIEVLMRAEAARQNSRIVPPGR